MEIIVGIDVSKDRLDVAVTPQGEAFAVGNDHAGIDDLIARLKTIGADAIALEATGGFETLAVAGLSSAGLTVLVVNPAQVRAYANAIGRRAKTDPIDAAVIAAFVLATKPEIRPLRDAETQALSELVARRRQIVQMVVAEENRLRMALAKQAQKSIKRLLTALRRGLDSLCRSRRPYPQIAGMAGARDAARLRAGRRADNGPHAAGRVAGTRQPRPAPDRIAGRPCALDTAVGNMEGQELHWWWQGQGARRAVHGRPRRQPP